MRAPDRWDSHRQMELILGLVFTTIMSTRGMVVRRYRLAGVETPALHAFRRQFSLSCLRSGINVYHPQNLMGHSDLQVLNRYC